METWESPDSTHPGITTTTWEDPDAEAGVHYTYRVAAFNELGRSPDDAKVEIDTVGNNVPNKVRDFQAVPTRTDATSAYVTLSWTAPRDFAIHTGATYLIEYALDIPDKIEWEEDWKTLSAAVAGTATTDTHSIVLEAWYLGGGTTPPVEYVPSTDKEVLNLDDADDDNDLILPCGIRYKYRIRAVDVLGREGLPVETEALLPMQDGLPPTVLIFPHLSGYDPLPLEGTQVIDEEACRQDYGPEFLAECLAGEDSDYVRTSGPQPPQRPLPNPSAQIERFRGCAAWEQQADANGNNPTGYRILIHSRGFYERSAVVAHGSYQATATQQAQLPW